MRKHFLSTPLRAARRSALTLLPAVSLAVLGCTDLEESPTSAITPDNFYRNEVEIRGGLASVYAAMRPTLWGYYNLSQVTTDENIVPTRGSDWFDNGRWLELHRHTWEANSPSGLDDIQGTWNDLFAGVSRANVVLNAMEEVTVPDKEIVQAELRTLRAFYYYMLMDMFGGVPIVTTTEITPRERATRAEVFQFVETELTEARAALPDVWPASQYGRLTKGAVDAILASMYLNAQVWTGTVTEAGLQPGAARWDDAIATADRVINSGRYALAADFHSNFTWTNESSPENIFVIRHQAQDGLGLNFVMRATHYNQTTGPSAWNGFATLAETYNAFDDADDRKGIFLEGPQVNFRTGEPALDRNGAVLNYTPTILDETQATESEGVRIVKFPIDPARVGEHSGNDFTWFRLAEMHLIKAEALNELNRTGDAIVEANKVRARAFEPDKPIPAGLSQAAFRDVILNERLFELTAEAKRRQDLIRHGKYTLPWAFKAASAPYRILMPIPQTQIETNPLLTQNAGY